jgi:hypothetical protein
MTNRANLARQLAAYFHANPAAARAIWATALQHLPPEGLTAIAARCGGDTMGHSLAGQLHTLAYEINTQPLSLGPK